MKSEKKEIQSRRQFIGNTSVLAAGMVLGGSSLFGAPSIIKSYNKPNSKINGVQIGCITYSFRSMQDQSAEATLKYVLDSGINAIELMGDPAEMFAGKPANPVDRRAYYGMMRKKRGGTELSEDEEKELADMKAQNDAYNVDVVQWRTAASMDKFAKLKKMYKSAGVDIYGFKPSAFGTRNTDAEIDYGLRAAKALGASHVTLELPGDHAHTLKLGTMASKHGMHVAYHGHEQQTPTWWDTALGQSEHNMMNLDLGHYIAAGNTDVQELISAKYKRISSMHLKDRQNPANGKKNQPFGQGDTPIVDVLQLMRDENFKFPASIELEYDIPDGSNAVQEVANCLEYCRKTLSS
ncbi:MAG: sugar phosphate isomerase/epimerase [Maribacter sp.]|nr:sugar phosphate isomerase/epimerase [Maribacter sp.]